MSKDPFIDILLAQVAKIRAELDALKKRVEKLEESAIYELSDEEEIK